MFRLSDFKERMMVSLFGLAFIAEIEVRANTALVANALYRLHTTAIAADTLVHLACLVSSLLAKVVNHQSLEGLSSVGLHFLLNYFNKIFVELVL
jgi:hypothetical protein